MIENKTYYYPVIINKNNRSQIHARLVRMFKNIKWCGGEEFTLKSMINIILYNNVYMCITLEHGQYRATYCREHVITEFTPLKIFHIDIL